MRKTYDCFTFYNELDLLEIRLNELDDLVDYFVIVEGQRTFQNKDKVLYYDKHKDDAIFSKFKDKIIHIIVPSDEFTENSWYNEEHQFNSIQNGLSNANDDDLVILGFLDEIPRSSTIKKLIEENFDSVSFLLLNFYYFFLDTKYTDFSGGDYWYGNSISPRKYLGSNLYQFVMKRGRGENTINDGGWHFSFLGDSEFVLDKINSYAHTEFKHLSNDDIKHFINNLGDPLGRNGCTRFLGHEILENLPLYVQKNIDKFKKHFQQAHKL